MSEARFDRIDQRLDRLETGLNDLRKELKGDIGDLRNDLKGNIGDLENGLRGEIRDLDHRMHVLHEAGLERIAVMREYDGPTNAEFRQAFADLREAIERRLDPLEAVVRVHSGDIRRHDADIEKLKRRRR